ncbi:MAG: enoyl-CoA hydratase/isomerase family protein, partial [Sneathiella sp.]|nr:enoyl-CoA hydratase/isomerase family protein [Sneathiella sp.]
MSSFFSSEIQGAVVTVTLTKPASHNVLNPEEMAALRHHLAELAENSDIRVGILTGEGKSFCAGADLGELKDYDFSKNPLELLTNQIENMPFPMICRLNGGVYGGGTDLALACDFRVGAASLKSFIPPAKIGIHYHGAGMARAVSILGISVAKRLFLAGEVMSGEQLKEVGFIDYLVAADALDAKVQELTDNMLALAPLSLSGMKATFNDIAKL